MPFTQESEATPTRLGASGVRRQQHVGLGLQLLGGQRAESRLSAQLAQLYQSRRRLAVTIHADGVCLP